MYCTGLSKLRSAGRGSGNVGCRSGDAGHRLRNADYMLQNAGQLEQNADLLEHNAGSSYLLRRGGNVAFRFNLSAGDLMYQLSFNAHKSDKMVFKAI